MMCSARVSSGEPLVPFATIGLSRGAGKLFPIVLELFPIDEHFVQSMKNFFHRDRILDLRRKPARLSDFFDFLVSWAATALFVRRVVGVDVFRTRAPVAAVAGPCESP